MKIEILKEISRNYPNQIMFDNIIDFENFDERLSAIDCIVLNIIGREEGFIEFTPDNTHLYKMKFHTIFKHSK